MKQLLVSQCDCCGLSVDPQTTENCPRCNYPVNPDKEERFLESAINDIQRVANYSGENIRVAELIRRYQCRLSAVRHLKELSSPVVPLVPVGAQSHVAPIAAQPFTPHVEEAKVAPAPVLSPKIEQVVTAPPPVRPQPPRRVFSLRSFFADQAINIVASVGAFLLLIGSLSFTITTSNLLVSFLVIFVVHAVFGITGFVTYRFPTFRIVATIYTIIFTLLFPQVVVSACLLGLFYAISYSLSIDSSGSPIRQLRFSILSMSALVLLWATLSLWLANWTRAVLVLAYPALASVLALCYVFDSEPIGYALALTGVALLYHGLNRVAGRRLQPFGVLSLGLDQIALVLVFVVPLISSPLLPLQLFVAAYVPLLDLTSFLHFQTSWRTVAELIAVGLGIILTVSVTFSRAGLGKTPLKAGWCWLLLLSGFLLNWEYSIVVLAFGIEPVWAFLGLTLATMAGAVVVRWLFGAAWANPLDVLALFGMFSTLSLSLNQNQDSISALLLSFAALLYAVLLYQQRQNWLVLPLLFALSALLTLWNRPLVILLVGVLLPLVSVAIHKFISNRWNVARKGALSSLGLAYGWEWPLLVAGLVFGTMASMHSVIDNMSAVQYTFGMNVPIAVEIALLSVTWYASSAFARMKLWLIPSIGFAIGALLIPNNSFWVLLSLTPVLALPGVAISRFAGRDWALPLYIVAVLSGIMTGYTGYTQDHLLATSWALLGFAVLAYIIGVIENTQIPMWILPVFAIWSVIISAGPLGDLYRPPTVALVCAALGVFVRFLI